MNDQSLPAYNILKIVAGSDFNQKKVYNWVCSFFYCFRNDCYAVYPKQSYRDYYHYASIIVGI